MQQRVQRVVLAPQVDVDPVAAAANPTEGAAHPLVHDLEIMRDLHRQEPWKSIIPMSPVTRAETALRMSTSLMQRCTSCAQHASSSSMSAPRQMSGEICSLTLPCSERPRKSAT